MSRTAPGARAARATLAMVTDAYLSLSAKPGRSVAMVTGIVLGVAGAVAAILLADTQQAKVNLQFDLQRSSYVIIEAQAPDPAGFPAPAIERLVELDPVHGAGELSLWVSSAHISPNAFMAPQPGHIVVADPHGLEATETMMLSGGAPNMLQGPTRHLAWLGQRLAQQLGLDAGAPTRGGEPTGVIVDGVPFSVAGVLAAGPSFGYVDDSVVVSRPTALTYFGAGENVRAVLHVRPGAAKAVGNFARAQLDPERAQTLVDVTPPDGKLLVSSVGRDLRIIGVALGGLVGLLGMVGVANVMGMAVQQRSRELGLRAALGWSGRRIAALILIESAIAGTIAGVLGCGLGYLGVGTWTFVKHWQLIVPTALPWQACIGATLASIVGGALPAWRASRLSPLEALRS